MNGWLAVLSASVATFAVTNVDDAFLLTLLFAQRVPSRRIVVGQYLGFALIIAASIAGSVASLAIPHRWSRLLGILPLALGIRHLLRKRKVETLTAGGGLGVISIALITASCGADNVGIYVPFFVLDRAHLAFVLVVYAVLVGVWCLVSGWLGTRLLLVEPWADRAIPLTLIALGIFLLSGIGSGISG